MAADLKLSLFNRLEELAPEYELFDLIVPSFVRKSGYRTDIAAADAVEALGALLEVATGVRLDFASALMPGTRSGVAAAGGHGHAIAASAHGGREEWSEGLRSWVSRDGAGGESVLQQAARRPPLAALENGGGGEQDGNGQAEQGDDGDGVGERSVSEAIKAERRERDWALRNFWLAWDALDNE